jgi:hypothetical protein
VTTRTPFVTAVVECLGGARLGTVVFETLQKLFPSANVMFPQSSKYKQSTPMALSGVDALQTGVPPINPLTFTTSNMPVCNTSTAISQQRANNPKRRTAMTCAVAVAHYNQRCMVVVAEFCLWLQQPCHNNRTP